MESALEGTDDESDCIVCYAPSKTRTICCKQFLCENCTLKWWEYKRQCPHCRKDMIDFDLWAEKYKNNSKEFNDNSSSEEEVVYRPMSFFFSFTTFEGNTHTSLPIPPQSENQGPSNLVHTERGQQTELSRLELYVRTLSHILDISPLPHSEPQSSPSILSHQNVFSSQSSEETSTLNIQNAIETIADALPYVMAEYNSVLSQIS